MTCKQSYRTMVRRWSHLWNKLNELKQPAFKSARVLLAQHIQRVKEAKQRKEVLTVECRKATQELNHRLAEAREVVSRIHSLLKATLGPRNEQLLDLGVPVQGPPLKKARPAEGGKAAPPASTPTAKS